MSDKLNEITEGSFLRVNEEGKAYWGQPESGSGGGYIAYFNASTLTHNEDVEAIYNKVKSGIHVVVIAETIHDGQMEVLIGVPSAYADDGNGTKMLAVSTGMGVYGLYSNGTVIRRSGS